MRWGIFIVLLANLAVVGEAWACGWDRDTTWMEKQVFPPAWDLLSGNFVRHSRVFYAWRLQDRRKKLKANPRILRYYDDMGVAYDKRKQHRQAIAIMLEKERLHPGLYETYANLGTFYIHAGKLYKGLRFIDLAIARNPDAHFGREVIQRWLVAYVLSKRKKGRLRLPLGTQDDNFADYLQRKMGWKPPWPPLSRFALAAQERFREVSYPSWVRNARKVVSYNEDGLNGLAHEYKRAIKGVLGMMRFGNWRSPILAEALGDLARAYGSRRLASFAYYRAAQETKDPKAKDRYKQASEALQRALIVPFPYAKEVQGELRQGRTFFAQQKADEARFIREKEDPEAAFEKKYARIIARRRASRKQRKRRSWSTLGLAKRMEKEEDSRRVKKRELQGHDTRFGPPMPKRRKVVKRIPGLQKIRAWSRSRRRYRRLRALRWMRKAKLSKKVLRPLLERLIRDRSRSVRLQVLSLAKDLAKQASTIVFLAQKDRSARVRLQALLVARLLEGKDRRKAFQAAFLDRHSRVRAAAATDQKDPALFAALAKACKDRFSRVRLAALASLAHHPKRALPILRQHTRLRRKERYTRIDVLYQLAHHRREALKLLRGHLKARVMAERFTALYAFDALARDGIFDEKAFRFALKDRVTTLRELTVRALIELKRVPQTQREALLLVALQDRRRVVRLRATRGFYRLGLRTKLGQASLQKLATHAEKSRFWKLRALATQILRLQKLRGPRWLRFFRKMQGDRAYTVRLEAVQALALQGKSSQPALVKALNDRRRNVRIFAMIGLSHLPPEPRHQKAIAAALQRSLRRASWSERRFAVELLTRRFKPTTKSVASLHKRLKDPSWEVRCAAALALGRSGSKAKASIPTLHKALKRADWRERRCTIQALGQLGSLARVAVPALYKERKSTQPEIRNASLIALRRILPKHQHTLLTNRPQ